MTPYELYNEVLGDPTRNWTRKSGANSTAIEQLKRDSDIPLPPDYLGFLTLSNGGEGEFGVEPGWFQLWRAEEVLTYHNGYQVPQYLPGYFAFASSGGGCLYLMDLRADEPYEILAVDSICMDELEYAMHIGSGFQSFIEQIGRTWQTEDLL